MKRYHRIFLKSISLLNLLSIIGIIVFGFLDQFSMFLLSTSIAILSFPWVYGNKRVHENNIEEMKSEAIKPNSLLEKYSDKFILPLLFAGWLYLLNRFVLLPVIKLYITLIWVVFYFGFFIVLIYDYIKESREKKHK
jgi:hypothetical protein